MSDRLAKEIEKINAKLRAGYGKASLRQIRGSLYLRATYPPKIGELVPKQRDLPLGLKATMTCLPIALERSIAISADLALKRFTWDEPTSIQATATMVPVTVSEFVEKVRAEYFGKREATEDTHQNWMRDYGYQYRRLPQDAPLSIEVLRKFILTTPPNSKQRNRAVMALGKLASAGSLEASELRALKGSYGEGKSVGRELPTLDLVIEWHDRLPAEIQYEFAIRAAFGLRPGEGVRWCKFENLKEHHELHVFSTKTRDWRITYPYPDSLFDRFGLGEREQIEWVSSANSDKQKTRSLTQKLVRLGLPFTLYDLRHLYAWHTILEGLDVRVAAQYMGHSVATHTASYNAWLNSKQFRQIQAARSAGDKAKPTE
jgi:integrase